jgi:hypothetical protein
MTAPDAAQFIDPKGIRIWSVSIPASLDLQGCNIPPFASLPINYG